MKKIILYSSIIIAVIITAYLILSFMSPEGAAHFTREDGMIESLSAVFYFIAAGISIFLFFRSASDDKIYLLKTKRNYFFLFLGLFLVFCGGEEISWGQRIFGIESGEYLNEINNQGETNLHNLYIFTGTNKDDSVKSGLARWLTGSKVYAAAWIFFCLLIPAIMTFFPKKFNFIHRIVFPVVPLWIGILFLINHFISKFFEKSDLFSIHPHAVVEVKETIYALLFLVACISLYYLYKDRKNYSIVK